jgi:hypothetical protein
MGAMAVPLPAGNVEGWRAWLAELQGPRKAEFEDMNARHGVTDHRAYLQPTPDGGNLVIVVTDGPGGDNFMGSMAASDNEFDRWFLGSVAEAHGVDMSAGGPPPGAERVL